MTRLNRGAKWPGGRRWGPPILLAVAVLLAGISTPGDAQPSVLRAAPRAAATGPGLPPPPGDDGATDVIRFDPVTPSVKKAKIQFSLRNQTLAINLRPCVFSDGFNFPDKCSFYSGRNLPTSNPNDVWYAEQAQSWIATTRGRHTTFGQFAAVRVHALAFGSIPVSATVHLSQTVHHNLYDPITLLAVVYGTTVDPGRVLYPGYGPAPDNGIDGTNFQLPITLNGTLDVRLSDVTVDEVPVRVGSSCTTSTPAVLKAVVPGGYSPAVSNPLIHRDRPGGFSPVFPPATADTGGYAGAGWLDGTVDIPAFHGCRNGPEDLDPLFTALVSGANNPISMLATTILVDCTDPSANCPARPNAAQQALATLNRTISNRSPLSKVRAAAVRVPKSEAVASLPPVTVSAKHG